MEREGGKKGGGDTLHCRVPRSKNSQTPLQRFAPPPLQSSLTQHGENDPPRPIISSEAAKTLWLNPYELITVGVSAFLA